MIVTAQQPQLPTLKFEPPCTYRYGHPLYPCAHAVEIGKLEIESRLFCLTLGGRGGSATPVPGFDEPVASPWAGVYAVGCGREGRAAGKGWMGRGVRGVVAMIVAGNWEWVG